MKIVRVFIQAHMGRQVGDIHDMFSPENHPGPLTPEMIKEVEVADDFDPKLLRGVVDEQGAVTFETDPTKVAADKQARIGVKYAEMDAEIMAQMAAVLASARADSAMANYQTLLLMKSEPSIFSDAGLLVDIVAGPFDQVGAPLDTPQKVQEYATERLDQVNLYGLFRIQRINQFKAERAAILAE